MIGSPTCWAPEQYLFRVVACFLCWKGEWTTLPRPRAANHRLWLRMCFSNLRLFKNLGKRKPHTRPPESQQLESKRWLEVDHKLYADIPMRMYV